MTISIETHPVNLMPVAYHVLVSIPRTKTIHTPGNLELGSFINMNKRLKSNKKESFVMKKGNEKLQIARKKHTRTTQYFKVDQTFMGEGPST